MLDGIWEQAAAETVTPLSTDEAAVSTTRDRRPSNCMKVDILIETDGKIEMPLNGKWGPTKHIILRVPVSGHCQRHKRSVSRSQCKGMVSSL